MPITTGECKARIVDLCRGQAFEQWLKQEFGPQVSAAEATKIANWKRESKRRVKTIGDYGGKGSVILREFDCRPYDSQLRAYVWESSGKIVKVKLSAE